MYYSVGHREPCGHRHRTRAGAERCARRFLGANRQDIANKAFDHGLTPREYIAKILAERTGDCLIAEICED